MTFCLLFCIPLSSVHAITCTLEKQSPTARNILLERLSGEWLTHCIYTAAELNISGHLQVGPKSIEDLAIQTKTNSDLLYRFMSTLASQGIFHELDEKFFSNNEVSILLSPDHPQSLYEITLFYKEVISPNWAHLTKTLQSGMTSFEIQHGMPVFKYFKETPVVARRFNAAMASKSNFVIENILNIYNFTDFSHFYDIGSGNGHFAYAALNAYPYLSATLFDLPEVIESAKIKMPSNLRDRCIFVSGDFFSEIPKNGDIYFLKSIIHDWPDFEAKKILKNCHQAMSSNSRLLIVEPAFLPPNAPDYAKSLDLLMMTITGGKERSLNEMQKLLTETGFELINIFSTDTEFSILEFIKK